jgi:3-oxoadipate enol-lactonase
LLPTLFVAASDAFGHAGLDVILEDREADAVERGLGRRQLLEQFDARTRLLHHSANASDLALDPIQPRDKGLLLSLLQHRSSGIGCVHEFAWIIEQWEAGSVYTQPPARVFIGTAKMREFGQGPPIVLIPGIQGRWEWMRAPIAALARRHRVLTFSLSDVHGPNIFDKWMDHIDAGLDRAGEAGAAIVGVSFGGLLAVRYAATRPRRAESLVLVSTPAPTFRLSAEQARYVAYPWLALPLFALRGAQRLAPEVWAAHETWPSRARAAVAHSWHVARAPSSPGRMASWVAAWRNMDLSADCRAVRAPTLVVTGERGLDRVVPVDGTMEYVQLIAGARHVTLPRTGHMGLMLRPHAFASVVSEFVARRGSE